MSRSRPPRSSLAVKLTKAPGKRDMRLLASGPRTGLSRNQPADAPAGLFHHAGQGELVIPEVTNQASFLAIGLDTTVMLAASAAERT